MTTATEFLTPEELAEMLGVPLQTIYRWNYVGSGPPVIHLGRRVRYRRADVEQWIDSRTTRHAA